MLALSELRFAGKEVLFINDYQISRPEEFLGLNLGEAHIIRNAGGLAYVIKIVFLPVSVE